MYELNGRPFDVDTDAGQNTLRMAQRDHIRPICCCVKPYPEMYIANIKGHYIVKRMPSTGADHALDCASYLPPEELSGLAQVQGSAIEELPDEGTTLLNFFCPYRAIETQSCAPDITAQTTRRNISFSG